MARPRKDPAEQRTETLGIRLTPAERLQLDQAASAAGLTPSEYARRLALQGRVAIRQSRALDPAVFEELRRIGVNLNQLARVANSSGQVPAGLAAACEAVERVLVRELDGDGP